MNEELVFRIDFLILLGILLVIRGGSAFHVRRSGERLLPDKQAVEREGRIAIIIRVILFVFLISFLVLYSPNPPWMRFLSFYLPVWLRWGAFILGLVSLSFWTWAQIVLNKEWSPQPQLRASHSHSTRAKHYLLASFSCCNQRG